jgi:hypothetical protein
VDYSAGAKGGGDSGTGSSVGAKGGFRAAGQAALWVPSKGQRRVACGEQHAGSFGGRWVSRCGQQRGCQGESDRSHGAGSSKGAGEVAVWYVCGEQLQCMCVWGALVEQCGVDRSAYVKRDDEA